MNISATLPPKPVVFHGRDETVNDAVQLLTKSGTARFAVLGSGGMGKTTVALAILHDKRIEAWFGDQRFFLSCEAHVDADAIVIALARLLGLEQSKDLLSAVVALLTDSPSTILVLDNFETVWLAGGAPVAVTEKLLGTLAQIPSLSVIITCRGTVLPQSVDWSNMAWAQLEPFLLEDALKTFEDRAGRRIVGAEKDVAKQLLDAVDRMPLAVCLLGQLVRRGNSLPELLSRWNRDQIVLLRTHGSGRSNNLQVSVELSIATLCEADDSQESLQLLSLCSMLPDGLRPDVFERLRPQFKSIDRARDDVTAYALATLSADRVLRVLSPIRHFALEHHPAQPSNRNALYSIYFDIADRLPVTLDERFGELAATAAPEMGNLSSLLLTLITQPSEQIVDAVLGQYKTAIESFVAAAGLFRELDDRISMAGCIAAAATPHKFLSEYEKAENLLAEALDIYIELRDKDGEGRSRLALGQLMDAKRNLGAAIEQLTAARQIFESLANPIKAAMCSAALGVVHLHRDSGDLEYAATQLLDARSVFIASGILYNAAESTRYLASARRHQGDFTQAEQLFGEAEQLYHQIGDRLGLAGCALELGFIRRNQGRRAEGIAYFESARRLYEALQMEEWVENCSLLIRLSQPQDASNSK